MSVDLSRYEDYINAVVEAGPKELTDDQRAVFREAFGPIVQAKIAQQRAEQEAAETQRSPRQRPRRAAA